MILILVGWLQIAMSFSLAETHLTDWNTWEKAKNFYHSKNFEATLEEFLKHPQASSAYYYNLGIVYFRLEQWGKSLAYFEKAKRMNFYDPDINYNIDFVLKALKTRYPEANWETETSILVRTAQWVSDSIIHFFLWLSCFFTLLTGFYTLAKYQKVQIPLFGKISGISCLICICLYSLKYWVGTAPPVFFLKTEAIRSGPGEQYMELTQLYEGTQAYALETAINSKDSTLWQQIRYSSDSIGWVPAASVLAL